MLSSLGLSSNLSGKLGDFSEQGLNLDLLGFVFLLLDSFGLYNSLLLLDKSVNFSDLGSGSGCGCSGASAG